MSSETPNGGQNRPPIPTPAKKSPALNIEGRGDRLYEVNYLHKWFAISSLLLFIFTVAMVLHDYSREWKRYQRAFNRMDIERTQDEMQQAASGLDRTRFEQLQQQLGETQAGQQQNETDIRNVQGEIDRLNADFYRVNQNFQFQKAIYDAEKYEYEEALASQRSNVQQLGDELGATEEQMNAYQAELDRLTIELRDANAELDEFVGRRNEIQDEIDAMLQEYQRLETRLNSLDPGLVVTSFRNAPVFDFMNPSERINQIILTDLYYDHPFKLIPRVDRCTTCHLGIDLLAFQDAPQPFRTHPDLDLYIGSDSPHPIESLGCTSCHGGLDRAVDFQTAGHMPRDTEQEREWEERYGWHVEEYLETPMFSMNDIEAGCYKCHNSGADVPQAENLNNGRDLIRIYGCFGCHRIPGYETVRKIGPDLTTVSGKLTREWVRKWLENPKQFKSEARMPQFWQTSNNSGPEWDARNAAEINAITEFLFSESQPQQLPPARGGGNADRGKELVESVGCFGCHAIGPIEEDPDRSQTRRMHGYNLASQGSKVSATWIYNWVRNPRQVWPETNMPRLRLTDGEAADVAAYLATLRNPAFEDRALPEAGEAALDEVTLELLRANSTEIEARERLAAMTLEQKNLFTGERLISRYGCYGCHTIPGFENAQPIGTELTEAGSKLLAQFDFGFLDIEHSRRAWYRQKLQDPRVFDVGRVRRPEELLKMPDFQFNDREVDALTMVLMSLVRDPVPLEMRGRPSAAVAEGRMLVAEKNCRGCHVIEGSGGDIRAVITEQAEWPPDLATEGYKTQPLWLHPFLKDPGATTLRSWMTVRMPTFDFTDEESAKIGQYFSEVDGVDYPFISTEVTSSPERLRAGAELFNLMQCASCHPAGSVLPPGRDPADLAPDLALAQQRLRPDWVIDWLLDPQGIMPGTRMPTFFPDGTTPLPNVLDGDVRAQVEAIRDHLFITLAGRTISSAN